MTSCPADIERVRLCLGMTREQFAALLGVAVNTVISWETGWRKPNSIHRRAIERLEQ